MKTRFTITAEHTNGMSDAHCCIDGIYDDPADLLTGEVLARDADSAVAVGEDRLAALVREVRAHNPRCRRTLRAGSDAWWNSVTVSAVEA